MDPGLPPSPTGSTNIHSHTLSHDLSEGNCSILGGPDLGHKLYTWGSLVIPYELDIEEGSSNENWGWFSEEGKVDTTDIPYLGIIIFLVAQSL